MKSEPLTHAIPASAPNQGGATFRALCGRLIHAATFSEHPTCPECQAQLAEDEHTKRALAIEFPDLARLLES